MSLSLKRSSAQQLAFLILLAAAAAALLPRIALTSYAFPSADDYCIVAETRDDGFWDKQVNTYLTWTGRYSAVFLESIFSQFDLIAAYPWFALLTLLLTLAAAGALVASIVGSEVSRLRITVIALAAGAVFVGGLPSTVEAFYWMPGMASYQWGIITYLAWLSLLIRRIRHADGRELPAWHPVAIVALTILLPGFNEVSAPVVLATLGAFILADRWRGAGNDRLLLMLFGISVLLTAFCFASPGNANRSGGYPALASRHNLPYAVLETARQTARFIVNFGSYPALWLGAFAAWWFGSRPLSGPLNWIGRPSHAAAVLLGLLSVLYLTLFPLYWEYGEMNYTGEGRTYNVTYIVLCAIVLTVSGVVVRALAGRSGSQEARVEAPHDWVTVFVPALLAVLLIVPPSMRQVHQALREAPGYVAEERARARELRRSPHEGVVFVDRITIRPAGLFWGDIEPDQSHWINICVAKYYRLQFVRLRM